MGVEKSMRKKLINISKTDQGNSQPNMSGVTYIIYDNGKVTASSLECPRRYKTYEHSIQQQPLKLFLEDIHFKKCILFCLFVSNQVNVESPFT